MADEHEDEAVEGRMTDPDDKRIFYQAYCYTHGSWIGSANADPVVAQNSADYHRRNFPDHGVQVRTIGS